MTNHVALGLRYMGLVITVILCGLLSGLFYPMMMGIRGAILGVSLVLGVVLANGLSGHRLCNGLPHQWVVILLAAVMSGVVGGLVVAVYGTGGVTRMSDFPPNPTTSTGQAVFIGFIYALLLHSLYALRWRVRRGWLLVLVPLVGEFGGVFKAFLTVGHLDAGEVLLYGLFSGVPFAVLWFAAVAVWDPAWSFARWDRYKNRE